MHALLTTVLAVANDSPVADKWVSYIVPQYVNRIAWTSDDGGYFEGQTYGHKFAMILEGLAALRTACGIDLFKQPALRNAGPYWLYAMNLNYWFNHWGDNYSLIWPWANPRDAYISGFLAAMTRDPYVKWYSDSVLTDPENIPFYYLSGQAPTARPPIDIAQARVFPETGTVTAYDRFYDHQGARVFFRSSPWGAHSHSHADQNAFVIHDGGEILAPDTGYYTYAGDTYHMQWSKSTFAHNSMLVNGKGQPTNIGSKGRVTEFFHGGKHTFFVGDASLAYEPPLTDFRRAVVFIRPGIWVVYDELKASKPASYSWLLNTFEKPDISPDARRMTARQQAMRLGVEHLLPERVSYQTDNRRPHPVKTPGRMWSRVTEASGRHGVGLDYRRWPHRGRAGRRRGARRLDAGARTPARPGTTTALGKQGDGECRSEFFLASRRRARASRWQPGRGAPDPAQTPGSDFRGAAQPARRGASARFFLG
jgi:hypothetical protein